MAWIEDITKRNQKEKHYYDNANPTRHQVITKIDDQHYHTGLAWEDVDENFIDDGVGGFAKKCDKTRHTFRVANGGARRWYPRRNVATEYVDITNIEYYTNRWRNLTLPTPVWTNNRTDWDTTNLSASLTNTWRRIKAEFVLKNSNAYTRLRFTATFVGLTYNATTGELTSITDGLVWGYINPPTAHDANDVTVPCTATYDGTYIEWNVDTTGATFPVYVDPTFTDGYGGDATTYCDTMTNLAAATTNYGTLVEFYAAKNATVICYNALLKFTLTTLEDMTITSATFSLFKARAAASGYYGTNDIYPIVVGNTGWTEAGAT